MEAMDLDCDGSYGIRSDQKLLNTSGRENQADFSDMDIDPGSPVQDCVVRSSSSFDHISTALLSILSLKNVSESDAYINFERPVLKDSLVPSQEFKRTSDYGLDFTKAWQPATSMILGTAGIRKVKIGYGIPDGDTDFAHFPNSITGSSLRRRQSANSSVSDTKVKQASSALSEVNDQKTVTSQSVSSESTSKKYVSCLHFISCFILVIIIFIAFQHFVTLDINDAEVCNSSRYFNKRFLQMELETNVYGQHLAARVVPDKIEEYFNKLHTSSVPQQTLEADVSLTCKPLVLSFDGWTGVGKNYISKIISGTFQNSKIINYIVPLNFPHRSFEDVYNLQIEQWITGNYTECIVNFFIVDEMDKAFPGVIDGLVEAIIKMTRQCSLTSPVIFLLLSNTHANDINTMVLKFLLDSPANKREHLSLDDFTSIFSPKLNVWYSKLASKHLIDASIPFLPLEREHVIQCIKKDLVSKRFSTNNATVNKVLHEMSFSSFGGIHLSQTGCKRVADKVDLVMFDRQH